MIHVTHEESPDPDWDNRLLGSEFGTIFQTSKYGMYEKSIQNSNPIYVKFYDEKNIVGQILLLESLTFKGKRELAKQLHKLPKLLPKERIYSSVTKTLSNKKIVHWTNGPIIFNDSYRDEISIHLADFLISRKKEFLADLRKSWKTKFEGTSHPHDKKFNFPEEYHFQKQKAATFIIDLNRNMEDIWENTDKKSVQKNIKRSQERDVTITEITTDNLEKYWKILNEYRSDNKLSSYTFEQVRALFSLVKSDNSAGFLAWYEKKPKEPIGGILFSAFNNYINEWGIARSEIDTEEKLYSQDLMRWKIIEWGKKNGCKYYDLSGVKLPEQSPSDKEKGIYQNKKKWGGEITTYPVFIKEV